jgi:UDP-N-acetylglucosamine transferase subunit ALG13
VAGVSRAVSKSFISGKIDMIFVTVGNSIKGVEFYRLIKKIDDIAVNLQEEVIAQIGYIDEYPKNIKWFAYMSFTEVLSYFQQASVIIGHGGVGTVINAITYKKPLIIVPRSSSYGEHFDDHQLELAVQLKDLEGIFVVDDIEQLESTIKKVKDLIDKNLIDPHFSRERDRLLGYIRTYVKESIKFLQRG